MSRWPLTTCLKNWNHLDQLCQMSRCTWPHDKGFRQTLTAQGWLSLNLDPYGAPSFSLTRALPVSGGELRISRQNRQRRERLRVVLDVEEEEEEGPREAAAATRRRTQHDPRHLVLMNTSSCHRAPHVSEPTPLCLFIHYLLRSSNKAAPARDTRRGWGVCRGSEWLHCLGQQKWQRWRVMGPPTSWQI